MIDEKKIEKAAINAADLYEQDLGLETYYGDTENDGQIHFCREYGAGLFKDGINWFLDNLWHNTNEKPEAFIYILAETEEFHKGYKTLMFHGGDPWEKIVKYEHITRWLYIDDLLKGGNI